MAARDPVIARRWETAMAVASVGCAGMRGPRTRGKGEQRAAAFTAVPTHAALKEVPTGPRTGWRVACESSQIGSARFVRFTERLRHGMPG